MALRGFAGTAALAAFLWLGLSGIDESAAQTPTPSAALLVFGVASVKLADTSRPSLPFRIGPDSLTITGWLKHLIMQAYEIKDYQVVGGPPWVQAEFYEVAAKADAPSSPYQIRVMLQALLADRFGLKLHRETRTMGGYVLSVDKGGAKLPPPKADAPPDSHGVIQMGGGEFWARGATMDTLAGALRLELGVPVVDGTKIEGHYNFKLKFEEENPELVEEPDDAAGPARLAPSGSIFTALHKLGLKLDPRKLPLEVFVIDSAERPSAN
jgi:uncharacterized protein (TIGR03435 family)